MSALYTQSSEERTLFSDKQITYVKREMNKQYTDYETCGTDEKKKKPYDQVFHLISKNTK